MLIWKKIAVLLALLTCAVDVKGGWLVRDYPTVTTGAMTFNGTITGEFDKQIHFALQRTFKDTDGEAADAMEHYFYGQTNGIAMELGGLDGSYKTGYVVQKKNSASY